MSINGPAFPLCHLSIFPPLVECRKIRKNMHIIQCKKMPHLPRRLSQISSEKAFVCQLLSLLVSCCLYFFPVVYICFLLSFLLPVFFICFLLSLFLSCCLYLFPLVFISILLSLFVFSCLYLFPLVFICFLLSLFLSCCLYLFSLVFIYFLLSLFVSSSHIIFL
jgi:hypothetical protein